MVRRIAENLHLVVKWSAKYGADTIEQHRTVAEQFGAVWWGLHGTPGKAKLSATRLEQIKDQLDAGQPTDVLLSGPTCWRTSLRAIAVSRDEVDAQLIPSYYPDDQQHGLWVLLADFTEIDRRWLTEHLELASKPGVAISAGALGNQTNPLIVHERGLPRTPKREAPAQKVSPRPVWAARVWWVCQGATYRAARNAGVLWAPKRAKDGRSRSHWSALQEANVGDLVVHYANGHVRATSMITQRAVDAPEPAPGAGTWQGNGWLVRADYKELPEPLPLAQIPVEWRIAEQRVFTKEGSVRQGYFYELSSGFVNELAVRFPQLGLARTRSAVEDLVSDYIEPPFPAIVEEIKDAGMRLDEQTIRRYHLSLKTRGFVILSGLSGAGKTWLAQLYAGALGASVLRVPVAPNWTTNEDLLGHYDPLAGEYRHTPFSRFLERSAAAWRLAQEQGLQAQPFHLVLDEMNLARVECYFAKFLSAMEVRSREGAATLELDSATATELTPNLSFIGTVNVDETTHGFADKIYDRAQLIELPVTLVEISAHLSTREYGDELAEIWTMMASVAPFAYRVLDEISSYIDEAAILGVSTVTALDEQLLQKVLPKIKGTDMGIGPALGSFIELAGDRWPLARAKAQEMLDAFEVHGFTSYF